MLKILFKQCCPLHTCEKQTPVRKAKIIKIVKIRKSIRVTRTRLTARLVGLCSILSIGLIKIKQIIERGYKFKCFIKLKTVHEKILSITQQRLHYKINLLRSSSLDIIIHVANIKRRGITKIHRNK